MQALDSRDVGVAEEVIVVLQLDGEVHEALKHARARRLPLHMVLACEQRERNEEQAHDAENRREQAPQGRKNKQAEGATRTKANQAIEA